MHGNSLILMLISYKTAKRGVHMDLGAFSLGVVSLTSVGKEYGHVAYSLFFYKQTFNKNIFALIFYSHSLAIGP